jgi:hypothetical protein
LDFRQHNGFVQWSKHARWITYPAISVGVDKLRTYIPECPTTRPQEYMDHRIFKFSIVSTLDDDGFWVVDEEPSLENDGPEAFAVCYA